MPGKTWLLTALVLGSSVACVEPRFSVGEVDNVLDLAECAGKGTVCDEKRLDSLPLEFIGWPPSETDECIPVEGDPWRIAWRQALNELPCGSDGQCSARLVSVAHDGSVWMAGRANTAGIFLVHIERNGELIAERVIETRENPHAVAIAADARGHLFVTMAWNERAAGANQATTSASLTEYDAMLEQVGESVELLGVSPDMELGLTAGESLILSAVEVGESVAGEWGPSRMAAFGPGLKRSWVQSHALPGAIPKLTLLNGEHLALGRFYDESSISPGVTLGNHDRRGNALGTLISTNPLQPFGMDVDGNLLLVDSPAALASSVRKIAPDGETLSSVRVARLDDSRANTDRGPKTALDSDGTVYLLREAFDDPQSARIARLVELDADGEHCLTSEVLDDERDPNAPSSLAAVFVTDAGEVYIQSQDFFARVQR